MVAYVLWVLYRVLEPILVVGAAQSAVEWAKYWSLPDGSISVAKVYLNRGIAMISWATAALLGYAVWQLMSGYLAGDIFSSAAAQRLRWVGITGLIGTVTDVVVRPFLVGILSMENFAKTTLMGWVDPVDLMYLMIALFVLSLGHIQGTAAAISDEHKQFV